MVKNNDAIIEVLSRLMVLRDMENQPYKVSAYQRVIQGFKELREDVTSVEDAVSKVKGIGKDIKKYIGDIIIYKDEDILTGIDELDSLLDYDIDMFNKIAFVADVTSVHKIEGVGVKKAETYYLQGIEDRHELMEYLSTEGIGRQKKGLKYDLKNKIPREKIDKFISYFQDYIDDRNKKGASLSFSIAGSYRRGAEESGDIDIILWSENNDDVVTEFKNILSFMEFDARILETLSFKENMYQGIAYVDDDYSAVRMDVYLLKDRLELPYALLYFTGNKTLNRQLRAAADKMGYHLGNTYMTDENGNNIIVEDEAEIFSLLNYDYFPPHERNW
jgi:DNA polymerase/3'-5' exonuclease PolX